MIPDNKRPHREGQAGCFGTYFAAKIARTSASKADIAPRLFLPSILLASLILAIPARAATGDSSDEFIRQQQRERALQQREERTPDVRLDGPPPPGTGKLPSAETPCFPIEHITLTGEQAERFAWALPAMHGQDDTPLGRCLGAEGINLVLKRIQNALIARGYVTTRVLAPAQDLKSGQLTLTVIPGRIRAIHFAEGTSWRATRTNAFPMNDGDLLNLRDIEQALENFKRVPTAEADIQIVPAEGDDAQPGESDLIVTWRQAFPLRLTLGTDDSGSKATGKYQGNLTVSGDNLLSQNDLFYVTVNHDLTDSNDHHGTRGNTLHYSLPFGYWQLAYNHSSYNYHQTVQGAHQNYVYSGNSTNQEIRLSHIVWRDAIGKTTLSLRGWSRESQNYIDDTEVEIQRRRMAGWELNLAERLFLGDATLDANLAYRRGTGAMNALPAPEENTGDGTSRPRLVTADLQFNQPFSLAGQRLRYNFVWRAQWNDTPLVPQDRFAIGGRYTVRGFDGENLLPAERGWLIRNDLGLPLGNTGQEAYIGLDYGHVGGPTAATLIGTNLAGGVIGLRGAIMGLNYDLFAGKPIAKPDGFRTAKTAAGFSLTWTF